MCKLYLCSKRVNISACAYGWLCEFCWMRAGALVVMYFISGALGGCARISGAWAKTMAAVLAAWLVFGSCCI